MDYILKHHGIQGQKWGVRRYQNADGTRTAAGKKRYNHKVLKAVHLLPKNEHGQYDEIRENFTRQTKRDAKYSVKSTKNKLKNTDRLSEDYKKSKSNVERAKENVKTVKESLKGVDRNTDSYAQRKAAVSQAKTEYVSAKTSLRSVNKTAESYIQAKLAVEQAKRVYKGQKRGQKLRVGVSRIGFYPNMRADAIQNAYDTYKRRGYSNTDAAYAAFGNVAVKKYMARKEDTRLGMY